MKTNIEQHIKSQLSERNLTPSENSWDKLSQMLDEDISQNKTAEKRTKTIRFPKFWTMAVAASVVIFTSVFVMNSLEQKKQNSIQIADTKKVSEEISPEKNEIISEKIKTENIQNNDKLISNEAQMVQSDSKSEIKIKSKQNSDIIQKPIIQEKTSEINLIQQELKLPEVKKQEAIAVVTEPETKSKPEKKKSSYVNPDMLLYSVENNEAISETNNDNSRLVIIDFNK